MSALRRPRLPAEIFRRCGAVGGIALVLLLSVLTASPELHHLLHGQADGATEEGCVVVQFAHGVSVTPDTALVAATPVRWLVPSRPEIIALCLTSPRYLHQPERGPPAS
ncbi:MAG: hypothetical protein NT173_12355 [Opitutales bacterium]|nr:hypothetical protein [Opitutales bacterium]